MEDKSSSVRSLKKQKVGQERWALIWFRMYYLNQNLWKEVCRPNWRWVCFQLDSNCFFGDNTDTFCSMKQFFSFICFFQKEVYKSFLTLELRKFTTYGHSSSKGFEIKYQWANLPSFPLNYKINNICAIWGMFWTCKLRLTIIKPLSCI